MDSKLPGALGELANELAKTAVISKEFKDRLLGLAMVAVEEAFERGQKSMLEAGYEIPSRSNLLHE